MEYQTLGAEANRGVDTYYQQCATDDDKPGAGLESVEFQLSLFSTLEDKLQDELLLQTLSDIECMQKDYEEMRRFLAAPTWAAEDALWRHLLARTNVNLTPGSACRAPEPGFFRLCFAAVAPETAVAAVRRVAAALG